MIIINENFMSGASGNFIYAVHYVTEAKTNKKTLASCERQNQKLKLCGNISMTTVFESFFSNFVEKYFPTNRNHLSLHSQLFVRSKSCFPTDMLSYQIVCGIYTRVSTLLIFIRSVRLHSLNRLNLFLQFVSCVIRFNFVKVKRAFIRRSNKCYRFLQSYTIQSELSFVRF